MVKFDRGDLIELLDGQTGGVTLTVAGMVSPPGEPFAGSDTIRVIDHGCRDGTRDALCEDEEADEEAPRPLLHRRPLPHHEADREAPAFRTPSPPSPTPRHCGAEPPAVGEAPPVAQIGAPPCLRHPRPHATDQPHVVEYTRFRPGESLSDVAAFFGTAK
jgi:hypothetical protein